MSKSHQNVVIPTRKEILLKILRKLVSPRDLAKYLEFKTISGNEYPYFDFVSSSYYQLSSFAITIYWCRFCTNY